MHISENVIPAREVELVHPFEIVRY